MILVELECSWGEAGTSCRRPKGVGARTTGQPDVQQLVSGRHTN